MASPKNNKSKNVTAEFEFLIKLPADYSAADVFGFHSRDNEAISEQVSERMIRKGVLLAEVPTIFSIEFDAAFRHASCKVLADAVVTENMQAIAQGIATGLLGLRINPQDFASFVASDPVFGPLTKRQRGLRIAQSSSIFEALTWAIMGQQINVSFAVSLRRTFVRLAGRPHTGGLLCYPSAQDAAKLKLEDLTARQFSRTKAETVLRLAELVASGTLNLDESEDNPLSAICEALLAVKGIGPWTVNYALLRGYGHADCSMHGDVAVRSAIGKLWGFEVRPNIAATEEFLMGYRPHRTMAAAHLWASLNAKADY